MAGGRFSKLSAVVAGGRERQDSVEAGFSSIPFPGGGSCIVLVHDGVRPFVDQALITRVIQAAGRFGAACPALPVEDTVKMVDGDRVIQTQDRNRLCRIQTPQGFSAAILKRALEEAGKDGFQATDEAQLVERIGLPVHTVPGERRNLKITSPLDLKIAEALIET